MRKILFIFERLKEAFNANLQNKKIYKPQIILALINSIVIIIPFGILYSYFLKLESSGFNFEIFKFSDLISALFIFGLAGVIFAITLVYFEAGLFQMYYKAAYSGTTDNNDFIEGTRKNFLKFIGINILTALMWIIIIPIYIIVGLITLGAGFILLPIVIQVFISMWKVSMVANGSGIIASFKSSVKFGAQNFVPLLVFILLMTVFISPLRQNNGVNVISDINQYVQKYQQKQEQNKESPYIPEQGIMNPEDISYSESINAEPDFDVGNNISDIINNSQLGKDIETQDSLFDLKNPATTPQQNQIDNILRLFGEDFLKNISTALDKSSGLIKAILLTIISVIALSTFISLLVRMLFKVFFNLGLFLIYKNGFKKQEAESGEVVQS